MILARSMLQNKQRVRQQKGTIPVAPPITALIVGSDLPSKRRQSAAQLSLPNAMPVHSRIAASMPPWCLSRGPLSGQGELVPGSWFRL